jgi:hypothetical protein
LRAARDTVRGGGPAGVRIADVHPPEGFLVPTVTVDLEIPLRNGSVADLSPGFPLPPPLAWVFRAGKVGAMVRDRFAE